HASLSARGERRDPGARCRQSIPYIEGSEYFAAKDHSAASLGTGPVTIATSLPLTSDFWDAAAAPLPNNREQLIENQRKSASSVLRGTWAKPFTFCRLIRHNGKSGSNPRHSWCLAFSH